MREYFALKIGKRKTNILIKSETKKSAKVFTLFTLCRAELGRQKKEEEDDDDEKRKLNLL